MTDWQQQNQNDRLYRRIQMASAPAKILATDDSGAIHRVQANLNGSPEIIDQLAVMQHYGLNTHAPIGSDAMAIFVAGQRSNGVIIATNNQQARIRDLKPGEVSVYTDEGDNLHFGRSQAVALTAGNSFQATTKAATIKGTDTVTLDSPVSSVTDKLVLAHDPEAPMEACTKQYADALALGGGGGGEPGPPGPQGPAGEAATIAVGTTVTGAAGTPAAVVNVGTPSAAIFDFTIPQGIQGVAGATGATGSPGAAASIAVGTTTTGAPGTAASVTNTGSSAAAVFNFTIPAGVAGAQGAQGNPGTPGAAGAAATIAVGTTTTGAPGTAAAVVNVGSSSAAVFNFTIPAGQTGATGATGPAGPPGTASNPGGANLQIQYNNAGAFGGAANWTIAAPNLIGNFGGSAAPSMAALPGGGLQIIGPSAGSTGVSIWAFASAPTLQCQRAEGTPAAPTATITNATLCAIIGQGYNGSAYSGNVVSFRATTTENWGATNNGVGWRWGTTVNGQTVNTLTMGLGMGGAGGLTVPSAATDMGVGTINAQSGYYLNGANIFAGLAPNAVVIGQGANNAPAAATNWTIPGVSSNVFRGNMNAATPNTPLPGIQLIGLDGTSVGLLADTFGGATYSQFLMRAAGGTGASPAALASNQVLGLVGARGWNSSAYTGSMAYQYFLTTEAWSTTANGCKIYWVTTPSTTATPVVSMTLGAGVTNASGGLVVGNSAQDMGLGTVNAIAGYYRAGAPLLGDWTFSPGLIQANNATSNWIAWTTGGIAAPTFTTRSVGTKLVLYPSLSSTATDYAIGIQSGSMWFGGNGNYLWYAGTTQNMSLTSAGVLTITGGLSATGAIQANGTGSALFCTSRDSGTLNWGLYAQGGVARFWNSTTGDLVTFGSTGNVGLLAGTTLTASNINCSAGTLTVGAAINFGGPGGVCTIGGNGTFSGQTTFNGNTTCFQSMNPGANNSCSVGSSTVAWNQMNSYNWFTASDRREKTEIESLPPSLDLVVNIAPACFRWAEGDDKRTHWGFIAQEVGAAMAEAGHDFGGHNTEGDRERLAYNELVAVLWQATRELAARVAHLEGAA